MKKPGLFTLLGLLAIFFYVQTTEAQENKDYTSYPYWIEMMQDQDVNFYEVQAAFEAYWKDRPITKGCGWKPFKRWEYRMQQGRINSDGTRKSPTRVLNSYKEFTTSTRAQRAGAWECLGPYNLPGNGRSYQGLGRINAIAFHPSDADVIYIGAPAGGIWMTDQGGNNWENLADDLPTLGVSAIIVDRTNPDVIYIGTGDRDAGDAEGMGVFKTTDGGENWVRQESMPEVTVGEMVQHSSNPNKIFAATSGGIYATENGGNNWTWQENGNFKQIVACPNDPAIMYATSSGNFYRTADEGASWEYIGNGITSGSRGVIAVSAADPAVVYFMQSNSSNGFKAIYRSSDYGQSFVMQADSPNILEWSCSGNSDGGQGWYDLSLEADPEDAMRVYVGGINIWISTDGGQSWDIKAHWSGDCGEPTVHADQHIFRFSPLDGKLYIGNDGGIYSTTYEAESFDLLTNGLAISQVYKIGQSATDIDMIINGYQDNGTSTYTGTPFWKAVIGGDGMECLVDYSDESWSYGTVYYGSIYRLYNNNYNANIAGEGVGGITESGAWVTPYCLHEGNPKIMFGGYKNIWRTNNCQANNVSWQKISNFGGDNAKVVEHSPADYDLFFAVKENGLTYRCENVNATIPDWEDITNKLPNGSTPGDIECHPFDANIVYLSQGGQIFKSEDRGNNWENISANLPNIYYSSIAFYENSIDGIYVSSNMGVFYRDAFLDEWVYFNEGLPVDASVNEVEIYLEEENIENDVIRAGTYGRGTWTSSTYKYQPIADFIALGETTIPGGGEVAFKDMSAGIPTSRVWEFEGGQPATSNERNPVVTYASEGSFKVKLTVSNDEGTDSKTVESMIIVSGSILPVAGFYTENRFECSGNAIHFYDTSLYTPISWNWEFTPNTVNFIEGTSPTSQNPIVEFEGTGAYGVKLTVANVNGSAEASINNYIHLGGVAAPFMEDFENMQDKAYIWAIDNPDGEITWTLDELSDGNHTMFMNFFDYKKLHARDYLISPPINLSNLDLAILRLNYAYTDRLSLHDSLIISVSGNCGESWTRVYANADDGNGSFITAEQDLESFVPQTADDWCGSGYGAECINMDISAYAGQPNIRLRFESYNFYGNNMYLDNIEITNDITAVFEEQNNSSDIQLYPNPAQGFVEISGQLPEGEARISLVDVRGKTVLETSRTLTKGTKERLELGDIAAGIYLLRIESGNSTSNRSLIVK